MMEQSEQAHTGMTDRAEDDCSPVPPLRLTPDDGLGSQSREAPQPKRKTVELAPSRAFDPSKEEVLRWAITVAHTHRRFHRDFIAIRLTSAAGKMAYLLDADPSVLDRLTPRLPSGLTVREPPTVPPLALLASATARVTLPAGLRDVPDSPDILGDFARVFAGVDEDEYAELVITLASADKPSAKEPFRLPKVDVEKVLRDLHHHATTDPLARSVAPAKPAAVPAVAKAVSPPVDPGLFFRVVLASHAFAESPTRARELALAVVEPFHAWAPSGAVRVTSRSSSPEALTATRYPRGRACSVVAESVVTGLLLPPTASCTATNVRRTAASAPVPPGLPGMEPGIWPVGIPEGSGPVGVPAREVLFGIHVGKPEWGKTTVAKTQLLAVTRQWPGSEEPPLAGGAFMDPHRDGVLDVLPFYWETPERVLFADFGGPWDGARTPVYNPFDCHNPDGSLVSAKEAGYRASAVVGSLSVVAGWDARATRSRPIAMKAAQLLVAMSMGLGPRDPAPTVFQIPSVLYDDTWRAKLLDDERVPPSLVRWWRNEGAAYKPQDFSPVAQVISRIQDSKLIAAFLGGRSTFTPREAMDAKMVMLFGGLLSGDNEQNRLAVSLILRMLIQGAYSRGDVPREIRAKVCPPFYCFVDELPSCDGPDLPPIFMELRKFLFRCIVMGVTPAALKKDTWGAAVTAASFVTTTSLDGPGAGMLNALGDWKDFDARDLASIHKYHHLTSMTFGEVKHAPIAVAGIQPEELFDARPGVVEAYIARDRTRYRDVAEVVAELDTLDDRLMRAWRGERTRGGTVSVGA